MSVAADMGNLEELILAAHAAQVTYHKALSLVLTGAVHGRRIGRRWYADSAELLRWKAEQAKEALPKRARV